MKVYLVWCGAEWEDDVLFMVFSKKEDAEKCALEEAKSDKKAGLTLYNYHVTEEEVE